MRTDLDEGLVRAFLAEQFEGVREIASLAGGQWSSAFGFEATSGRYVIRFGRYREDYEKDACAAAWASRGLPVAEVVEIGDAFDGSYAVSKWVDGTTLDALAAADLRATLPALLAALGTIGEVDLPGTRFGIWLATEGDAPYQTWSEFLTAVAERDDERIHGWKPGLDAISGARGVFDEGARELASLAAACGEVPRRLVHGDLLAGNVLVVDHRVTGVIDWGNALAGDPLYDAAGLMFWSPWHPGLDREHVHAFASQRWGGPNFDERLRCCELHVGLDAMQYDAFTRRVADLEAVTPHVERLLATAR